MMTGDNLIDAFGEVVDKVLLDECIQMVITLPEGSMEADIASSFNMFGEGKPVMDFYILLHALRKAVNNLMDLEIMDKDKKGDMIDGMLEMVKKEVMREDYDENTAR